MSEKQPSEKSTGLEIAVIGMAGRFPGAQNVHELWENLKNGKESVTFFSREELIEEGIDIRILDDPSYIRAKSVLDDVEYFDAPLFNFTPNEAEVMDPQLRLLIECSWHALEDGGYNPFTYGGAIGVYAGNANNYHWIARTMVSSKSRLLGPFKTNLLNSNFSTHISYHLNLKGPSLSIQTACSTSLVAIHTACIALLSSECDMALAGGVSLSLPQKTGYYYQPGLVLSPDGHCRAFDSLARGTVSGAGVGMVLLKRFEDALADADHIYALIKGTALNNDGLQKVGYTAPSVEGQAKAMRAAYIMAEVKPATIGYIEAHGTGTELGDPVEIEALNMVFKNIPAKSIPIGSIKSNLGHLDAAAGVAGFIKAVMVLHQQIIPPSLHFNTPNPRIDFNGGPFYVIDRLTKWERGGSPRRAAVSSFGLGGTNAHAVLEEAPEIEAPPSPSRDTHLLMLSARTPASLERLTDDLGRFLKECPVHLPDAAYTLQVGRRALAYRRVVTATSTLEAAEVLTARGKKLKTARIRSDNRPVVFLLSGQGSQYPGMGSDLYQKEEDFKKDVDYCFSVLSSLDGQDLKDVLYPHSLPPDRENPSPQGGLLDETEITQPVVFIFEYALARLLMTWGIKPTAMIGYSLGEYVAACLAGVFSLEDALKLITTRGRLMQKTGASAMLGVPLAEEELKPLLTPGVYPAIINGPSCIVAGEKSDLEAFEQQMRENRLMCAPIHISHAVHSPLMEPIRREFEAAVGQVQLKKPQVPYLSNVTGTWIDEAQATDPGYWGQHLCRPVRFSAGLKELLKNKEAVFIEIGPGRVLSNILRQVQAGQEKQPVVNVIKHQPEKIGDDHYLVNKIGDLWLLGVTIDWGRFYAREKRSRLSLPLYPYEKLRFWIDEDPFRNIGAWQNSNVKPPAAATDEPVPVREPGSLPGDFPDLSIDEEYEAPRDELEECIAGLWQEFLGLERIGIHSNFFDINGDSLTATQMITRLHKIYPVEITLQGFFENPTIVHLAEVIRELLLEKVKELSEEELDRLEDSE